MKRRDFLKALPLAAAPFSALAPRVFAQKPTGKTHRIEAAFRKNVTGVFPCAVFAYWNIGVA